MTALDAMRMVLEALQSGIDHRKRFEIVTTLRAAIAEMERAEPVAWSLETDYYYYVAEKHNADLSHCDGRENGTVWFNEKNFLAFCRELHTYPAAPSSGYQPFQHFGPVIPPPKNPNIASSQVDPNFPFGDEVFVKEPNDNAERRY